MASYSALTTSAYDGSPRFCLPRRRVRDDLTESRILLTSIVMNPFAAHPRSLRVWLGSRADTS